MCILTRSKIIEEVNLGRIVIDPFNIDHVGPNSVDLCLGGVLKTYFFDPYRTYLCTGSNNRLIEMRMPTGGIVLQPGELYLGSTVEIAGSDHYVPMLETRSGYARIGLSAHLSAGFGDVGFKRQWTLEITVVKPVLVFPFQRICQVYFQKLHGEIDTLYSGMYSEQSGPTGSRLQNTTLVKKT